MYVNYPSPLFRVNSWIAKATQQAKTAIHYFPVLGCMTYCIKMAINQRHIMRLANTDEEMTGLLVEEKKIHNIYREKFIMGCLATLGFIAIADIGCAVYSITQ